MNKRTSVVKPIVAALALTTLVGCKPLDDAMVAVFGRSMRDSRSFDPYENPRAPAEGSVAFAAGNFPSADGVVNLAFGMTDGSRLFSKRQINLLEAIFPVVEALIRRHWHNARSPAANQTGLRQRLHVALSAFGASVLTRREREVIELVLLGNSTRLIAEKLQISTETIKLHRKHAYAKLDISSQAELFYLFVDAIACHTGTHEEDPLLSYHSQQP